MAGSGGAQGVARARLGLGERKQQVLGRDVLVIEVAGLLVRGAQDRDELGARARRLAALAEGWQRVERGIDLRADRLDARAELVEDRNHDAGVLLEQDGEQVLGGHLRVAAIVGELLRGLDRLLGLDRESVWLQGWIPVVEI